MRFCIDSSGLLYSNFGTVLILFSGAAGESLLEVLAILLDRTSLRLSTIQMASH